MFAKITSTKIIIKYNNNDNINSNIVIAVKTANNVPQTMFHTKYE